jgi:hypothetical protein
MNILKPTSLSVWEHVPIHPAVLTSDLAEQYIIIENRLCHRIDDCTKNAADCTGNSMHMWYATRLADWERYAAVVGNDVDYQTYKFGAMSRGQSAAAGMFVGVICAYIVAAARRIFGCSKFQRWSAALRDGRCPTCDYLLTGLGPHPWSVAKCPECGTPWPLIPPPASK